MAMQFQTFTSLLASLALASARDTKFMKTVPTISNSLVNLGKMEISLYFNGKHQDNISPNPDQATHNKVYSPLPVADESCPCTNFKPQAPSFLSNPTEIINKILKSNDLLTDYSSSVCCESVEHIQEGTVVLEVNPNNVANLAAPRNLNNLSMYPKTLRALPPFNPFTFNNAAGVKPKAVEIFMFPRRKDMTTFEFPYDLLKPKKYDSLKSSARVVGDRELNFKSPSASVKKDLTLLEKKNKQEITEAPKQELQTEAPPVNNVNNTL